MTESLIPLTFYKIMQARAFTVFVLGTQQKQFAIYTEAHVGQVVQATLASDPQPRPWTHNLLGSLITQFDITPLQVVIHDVEETIYFARLFLERMQDGQRDIVELDARPSDCIILALLMHIPVFCTPAVLEKVIPLEGD